MTTPAARPHRALNKVAFLLLLLTLIAQVGISAAQIATGRLTGTVKDASGAVVTGAEISLTNNATGVTITVPSTSTGTYLFEAVNPETYTLKAESPGFKGFTSPNIDIHIQQITTVDVTLSLGAASEEITVQSSAPLLQAEDASIGQTIDRRTIDNLPLSTRDWVSLGQLAPGVTTIPGQSTNSDYYTVNGTNYFQNDFRLNGIDDNIEVYGGNPSNASVIPPPDAIQEFKLQTGDFSAEFGHSTGAVINAVIKSGGNKVHGDLWEYLRNDVFNANDYFSKRTAGSKIPEYRQNQFGGTIGGPVYIPKLYDGRNKTFFFFDYQGGRFVNAVASTQTVPTSAMVSSGFTNLQDLINTPSTLTDGLNRIFPLVTVFDPSTTRLVGAGQVDPVTGIRNGPTKDKPVPTDVTVKDPFFTGGSVAGITDFSTRVSQLNILPAGRLSPAVIKLLQLYPAANRPGLQNNYFKNFKSTNTVNQYDVRIDQNIGTKDILFGAYDWAHAVLFSPTLLPGIADGQNYGSGTVDTPTYSVSIGYTHLFTTSLTNEFHFGFNHLDSSTVPPEGNTLGLPAQYGIPGIPQFAGNGGLPAITLNNFAGLGVSAYTPTIAHIHSIEYTDNVTKNYHSHTFKAGFQLDSIEGDITQPPYGKGVFTYDGRYTSLPNSGVSLTSISDALLIPSPSTVTGVDSTGALVRGTDNVGGLASYQGSNYAASNDHRYYFGAYFQDDWKATPNLTLNLGLRWDRTTPYVETSGRDANFVAGGGGNGPGGIYYLPQKTCNAPRNPAFDALLSKDGIAIKCVDGLALGNAQYTNFAPRLGFAYRITPTFVVRGGYGIAYGALDNIGYGGTINANYPFEFNVGFNSPNAFQPLQLANGQTATIENGFSNINLSDPSQVSPQGLSLVGRQYNFQTPYTQTFNLTLQRQIGRFDSIQAGYVAALGRHLDIQGAHNAPSALAAPGADLSKSIPFPDFNSGVAYETTNGASSYNSLQVVYARSASHGLSGNANYTYSKCMSNAFEFGRGSTYPRAQWLPGFGVGADNQPCDSDVTHLIHASGTYELPVGKGRQFLGSTNRIVDTVIGGWDVNYIFTHQSGQPFTIGCAQQTNAFFGCNAIRVPGQSLYSKVRNTDQWLNPNAFTFPAVYGSGPADTGFASLGGQGNQARGPALNVLDASVFKEFPIVEQIRVVFRAEAFNLANTPQFGLPNNNLDFRNYSAPVAGNANPSGFSSTTALRGSPRTLQFALKLYY